jgi:ABC-type dipeptide/oligopeptide/nickel transport system ATPase component
MSVPVLSVRDLQVEFATRHHTLRAIDGVSLEIARGEVLGVVGESGAGKSVTGLAVIGLIDPPAASRAARFIYPACGSTICRRKKCARCGANGSA